MLTEHRGQREEIFASQSQIVLDFLTKIPLTESRV